MWRNWERCWYYKGVENRNEYGILFIKLQIELAVNLVLMLQKVVCPWLSSKRRQLHAPKDCLDLFDRNLIKSAYGLQNICLKGELCLYFNSSMRLGMVVKSWSAHIVTCSPMTWADTVVTYNINSNSKLINEAHPGLLGRFSPNSARTLWCKGPDQSWASPLTAPFLYSLASTQPQFCIVRWVEGRSWRIVARRGANGQKRSWTGFLRF